MWGREKLVTQIQFPSQWPHFSSIIEIWSIFEAYFIYFVERKDEITKRSLKVIWKNIKKFLFIWVNIFVTYFSISLTELVNCITRQTCADPCLKKNWLFGVSTPIKWSHAAGWHIRRFGYYINLMITLLTVYLVE